MQFVLKFVKQFEWATRSGYIFNGWYDSSGSYGDYYPSSGLWSETSSPYTLYAHWIKA